MTFCKCADIRSADRWRIRQVRLEAKEEEDEEQDSKLITV